MIKTDSAKILAGLCLHGRVTVNPYTGESVYVPCGTCYTCRYNKSRTSVLKINAERQIKKYCYFGSLTYSSKYIPRYAISCVSSDSDVSTYLATPIPRCDMYSTRVIHQGGKTIKKTFKIRGLSSLSDIEPFYFNAKPEYVRDYCTKSNLAISRGEYKYPEFESTYGFIAWDDLALFMKRVRKRISKITDEKISTYLVAEYGPVSFRPHFHFLFFFDSEKLSESIRQIVLSCWKFGRVDCSSSRGDAEQYVANYTNSFSRIPQHLSDSHEFRPRSRFSNNFGSRYFARSLSKAVQGDFSDFIDGVDICINGSSFKLRPPMQVVHSCFLPYALHRSESCSTLYSLACAFRTMYRRFRGKTDYSTAVNTYNYYSKLSDYELSTLLSSSKLYEENILFNKFRFVNHSLDFDDAEMCINRFYNFYHTFSRFFRAHGLFVDHFDRHKLYNALDLSLKFYKLRDYENLRSTYEIIESCKDSVMANIVAQTEKKNKIILSSSVGIRSQEIINDLVNSAVKHRELNDSNINFTNSYSYGKFI